MRTSFSKCPLCGKLGIPPLTEYPITYSVACLRCGRILKVSSLRRRLDYDKTKAETNRKPVNKDGDSERSCVQCLGSRPP
jgi:hypothetical protein